MASDKGVNAMPATTRQPPRNADYSEVFSGKASGVMMVRAPATVDNGLALTR
jgi:hypothetical protein